MTSPSFNYGSSTKSDKILRYALWRTWGEACYWCGRPLEDSTYAQIDHILPQSNFSAACDDFNRPSTFEMHAAENLAPMCEGGRRCNQKKPEKNLHRVRGAIEQALSDAVDYAPKVRDLQIRIAKAKGVDKAFISFITEELDARTRRIAEEYGSQLVQKIHEISPKIVDSYFVSKAIHGQFEPAFPHEVRTIHDYLTIKLDADARFAFNVAKRVYGEVLEQRLGDLVDAAMETVASRVEKEVPSESPLFDDRSETGFVRHREIALSFRDLSRMPGNGIRIRFMLSLEAEFAASGVKTNQDGDLIDVDLEWNADTVFSFIAKLDQKGYRAKQKIISISITTPAEDERWAGEPEYWE